MMGVRLITVMAANGLTVIRKTVVAIAAWSNGANKEKLIGVGFVRTPDMERCELYEKGLSARQVYLKNLKKEK